MPLSNANQPAARVPISDVYDRSKLIMVDPSRQNPTDLGFMDLALEMAAEALAANEIPVGCVFVDAESLAVVARGRNRTNEARNACVHAEFDALSGIMADPDRRAAVEWARTVCYVSVEPCVMCASALRQIGIRLVFFGCSNDRFGGCGGVLAIHNDARLAFSKPFQAFGGYRREEAIMLLRRFYITENSNAPVPKKKTNRVLKTEMPMINTI